MVCNRHKANVITRRVYVTTRERVSLQSFVLITYRNKFRITSTALQWLHTQPRLRFHTMLRIDFASLDLNFCFCYTVSRGEIMKDNPLMKYSEQLAVEIEKMCKSLDNKKRQC